MLVYFSRKINTTSWVTYK